jgi:hypothetical protein
MALFRFFFWNNHSENFGASTKEIPYLVPSFLENLPLLTVEIKKPSLLGGMALIQRSKLERFFETFELRAELAELLLCFVDLAGQSSKFAELGAESTFGRCSAATA